MMDATNAATNMYDAYKDFISNGGTSLVTTLATIMDNEFQNAATSLSNIDITTPANTLVFNFDLSDLKNNPYVIADAIVKYWSNTINTTGTPVPCDNESDINNITIDSVSNNADTITNTLANAIISNADGKTHNPPYYDFFNNIFTIVKTIEWTVIEKSESTDSSGNTTTCEQTFTVTIS